MDHTMFFDKLLKVQLFLEIKFEEFIVEVSSLVHFL